MSNVVKSKVKFDKQNMPKRVTFSFPFDRLQDLRGLVAAGYLQLEGGESEAVGSAFLDLINAIQRDEFEPSVEIPEAD